MRRSLAPGGGAQQQKAGPETEREVAYGQCGWRMQSGEAGDIGRGQNVQGHAGHIEY